MNGDIGQRHKIWDLARRLWRVLLVLMMVGENRGQQVAEGEVQKSRTAIAVEAVKRLKGIDLEANPALKGAVLKVLESTRGTPQFVELVRDFRFRDQGQELFRIVGKHSGESVGVEAMRLILELEGLEVVKKALDGPQVLENVRALGNVGGRDAAILLQPLVLDGGHELAIRKEALRGMARYEEGAEQLLQWGKEEKLPPELRLAAAWELGQVRWPDIKKLAEDIFPLPQTVNAEPLPRLEELLQKTGDAGRGAKVYAREEVGCIQCHQVQGRGVNFGPNLSEIGTKLGKDALYTSILDPNAGISFGYEAWLIELKNGDEAYGIVVSETEQAVTLKAQTGIVTEHKRGEIVRAEKMKQSIMPSGLQQTMSAQDLIDLVEYLSSLKKPVN